MIRIIKFLRPVFVPGLNVSVDELNTSRHDRLDITIEMQLLGNNPVVRIERAGHPPVFTPWHNVYELNESASPAPQNLADDKTRLTPAPDFVPKKGKAK